jgi:hypothetical protein
MYRALSRELAEYERSEEELPFTIDRDGDDVTQLRVTLTPAAGTPMRAAFSS